MTAPLRPYTPWSHLDRKGNARFRRIEQTSEARYAAVMAEAERINEAWRNRTPEQVAALNQAEMNQYVRAYYARRGGDPAYDLQKDIKQEADEQGITVRDLMRTNI